MLYVSLQLKSGLLKSVEKVFHGETFIFTKFASND